MLYRNQKSRAVFTLGLLALLPSATFAWQIVTNGLPAGVTVTKVASSGGDIAAAYVSTPPGNRGIYFSTNGGTAWFKGGGSMAGAAASADDLMVRGNTVFAARLSQANGTNAVMYTPDFGTTWLGAAGISNSTSLDLLGNDGAALFTALKNGNVVYRSVDNGTNWTVAAVRAVNFNNGTVRSLGGHGGVMTVATGDGHYQLTGPGTNWVKTSSLNNHALGARIIWQGGVTLAGYADPNRRIKGLADGTATWFDATNGVPEGQYFNLADMRDFAAGDSTAFAAGRFTTPAFLYQLRVLQTSDGGANWMPISTANLGGTDVSQMAVSTNSLLIATGGEANGLYRVRLANGLPVFPPFFTRHPTNVIAHPGTNITLTVNVSSDSAATYQWRKDGVDLPGETTTTLYLPNAQTNVNGSYTFFATNAGGATVSAAATVKIIPRAPGYPDLNFQPGFFAAGDPPYGYALPLCIAAQTNGLLLVGGIFTYVHTEVTGQGSFTNGVRSQGIARFNPDGSVDSSFLTAPGINANGTVNCVLVQPDGKILIGGQFSSYNGVTRTNIARLNSDGSVDSNFAVNAFNNNNASVQQMALQADGRILIAGFFSSLNGSNRFGAARLNADGTFDPTWPTGSGVSSQPNAVTVLEGDDSVLGGSFFGVNGINSRRYLTSFDAGGVLRSNFNHGLNSTVEALQLQPGGLLWASGSFTTYSNAPITGLVRLASDGSLVGSVPAPGSNPKAMVMQADGSLVYTHIVNNNYRGRRLTPDGVLDPSLDTAEGFDSQVYGMVMPRSGDLFAVGLFTQFQGVNLRGMVRIFANETNVAPALPVITLTPQPLALVAGSNGVLRAAAFSAETLGYFWLKDGAVVADANNNTLPLLNMSGALAGQYQFVATNSFGAVTSAVAVVSTASVPAITQQVPINTGATNGGTLVLSFGVSGTGPLGIQWYRNGGFVQYATNNPLVITNFGSSFTGNWYALVTNIYGRATTDVSNVQIGVGPTVRTQPDNQTLNGEGNISLSVIANVNSSAPLGYLWFRNDVLLRAILTNIYVDTLTVSNALPADGGSYKVVITNFIGSVTSAVRTVTVRNPFISQTPASLNVQLGDYTNFSVQAVGTAPISYYWYARGFGSQAGVTNLVGTGATLNFGPITEYDGLFNYYVVASNQWSRMTSGLASFTIQYAPVITNIAPGTAITAELNENVYFSVLFKAQPYPVVRWFKDGVYQPNLFSSAVNFYPAQATNDGTYQLVLSNFLGSVTSAPIVLTIKPARPPTITTQPVSRLNKVGDFFNFSVTADGTPVMYYRWFRENGPAVGNWASSPFLGGTIGNTNEAGNYFCVVTNAYGSATSAVAQLTVIVPQPATYANKVFVKIADSATVVPGLSPVRYASFRDSFLRGGQVWFGGVLAGTPFSAGVYHWSNSTITKLVDTNTLIPSTNARFTNYYGSTFLSDGKVVFVGNGNGGQHGLYAWSNNAVVKLYDTNTIMPGRSENFERFGWPTVAGNQFAFLGFHTWSTNAEENYRGVYVSSNGVLLTVADTNTPLPNVGGTFVGSSSQVGFDGTRVAWWGWNRDIVGGIFTDGLSLPTASMADALTAHPVTGVNFDGFISPPNVQNGRVYLVAHDEAFNTSLMYRDPAGPLTVIAKPGDAVPSRGIPFDSVGYPYQAGTTQGVFFDGGDGAAYTGIFFWNGTNSVKVIDSLDKLDGVNVVNVFVADAEGDCVLFNVSLANGRNALYATLPPAVQGETFAQWTNQYSFPVGEATPESDPDHDGVRNIFEYYFGSNPLSALSAQFPAGVIVEFNGTVYPALSFIRSKNLSGVTLIPQVSSSILFSNSLGVTVHAVVDLGDGRERVTIRSTVSLSAQNAQFLRIQLSIP